MGFWKICKEHGYLLGMALGGIFLGIGAFQGQLSVVWKKAVMICMECIGLG